MLPRELIETDVRRLVERLFLQTVNDRARVEYAGSSFKAKRVALRAFLQDKSGGTKQWARALQDLV